MTLLQSKGSHVTAMTGLTRTEALFTIELLKDGNAIRAGQALGMSPDDAFTLSVDKRVRAQIERVMQDRLDDACIDVDWLLYELRDNHVLARQLGSLAASNKALELIGKLTPVDAFASTKLEHSGEVGLVVNVKRYSDAVDCGNADVIECDEVAQIEGGRGPQAATDVHISFL